MIEIDSPKSSSTWNWESSVFVPFPPTKPFKTGHKFLTTTFLLFSQYHRQYHCSVYPPCLPVLNLFVRKQNQVFYKAWLLDLLQYLLTSTSSWLIFFSRFFSNLIFFLHVPDVKKKNNDANTDTSLGWSFTDSKSSVCETQNSLKHLNDQIQLPF